VGSYTALEWVTTSTSGQTNQLVIGSTLQISLNADGSTAGHMHLAASNGQPAQDFDLAGRWSASSTAVALIQTADTFLNDMIFALEPIANDAWDLVGDITLSSGTRIELRLTRNDREL
jgi:hypothetical protein